MEGNPVTDANEGVTRSAIGIIAHGTNANPAAIHAIDGVLFISKVKIRRQTDPFKPF